MLEHGGRLRRAAHKYGIPWEQWLDLSTGISPFGWPVPAIPPAAWQWLPEEEDGLMDAAYAYYAAPHILPVAGSQAAIQALPSLRAPSRVGIIAPGYAEHRQAWERAGHQVSGMAADALFAELASWDVLVLIHPNNPGGDRFEPEQLLQIHEALAARGGWLVVDEAFMDVTPDRSLCPHTYREGLIVLRSAGKFFGLAGARAGFVCAAPALLNALQEKLGPWTLSGPTRYVLQHALVDTSWQMHARERLLRTSERLSELLSRYGLAPAGGCGLFQWCLHVDASWLHGELASRGILVRLFDTPSSLRFGLPRDEIAFERLDRALGEIRR